ncbi:MAG: PHP domain-containing protein [Chloroflexota bacterium]
MTAFVDLHCHTSASPDSLASPRAVAKAAAERGLTHLAITDHGTLSGAFAARDSAPAGLTIHVGQEVKTSDGDLIAVFLEHAIRSGRPAADAIAEIRDQGGLVGLPHPFDRWRGSVLRDARLDSIGPLVDWVEVYNARVVGGGANDKAAEFARVHERPGVAASDAHSTLEVAVAYNVLNGDPSTPAGLLAALPPVDLVVGRGSYIARLLTPIAKLVHMLPGGKGAGSAAADDPDVAETRR